jgi:hypothetical protein
LRSLAVSSLASICQALSVIAATAGEQDSPEDHLRRAGRLGDLVGLTEERRSRGQLTLEAQQQ